MNTTTATPSMDLAPARTGTSGFTRALRAVFAFFEDIGRARRASIAYEALSRLSDEELETRGLTRATLAKAAFDLGFARR